MSEQPKTMKIVIDKTETERKLQESLDSANRTIGALMAKDREDFVRTEPMKANENGETALYTDNDPQPEKHVLTNVDASTIPLEWVHGKTDIDVLTITKDLADKGNVDAKKAIRTITRRSFKDGLNLEFRGSIVDFNRHELPINDSMSAEEQLRRKKRNDYLVSNRCNWHNLNGDA